MRAAAALLTAAVLCLPAAAAPPVSLDLGEPAVQRGEGIYRSSCQSCHPARYLRLAAQMPQDVARTAFGKAPPDLSLIASARGRGDRGARYVAELLLAFNETAEKNAVLPNIAMPPVFAKDDPEAERKAADVAAFLHYASDPSFRERERLGRGVLGYMAVLTLLLFLLHRRAWRRLPPP